jgi:hypothetical protein
MPRSAGWSTRQGLIKATETLGSDDSKLGRGFSRKTDTRANAPVGKLHDRLQLDGPSKMRQTSRPIGRAQDRRGTHANAPRPITGFRLLLSEIR